MEIITNPSRNMWIKLLERPGANETQKRESVQQILLDVRKNGDKAIRKYTRALDNADIQELRVDMKAVSQQIESLDAELKRAINQAAGNIKKFHRAQKADDLEVEVQPGITCMQRSVPLEKVGIYVPGGNAPLFSSVLMLAIPAAIAGCREIYLFTPPGKDGNVDPAILYAAKISGVRNVYRIGGAQAIAAMAYGTETIPAVDKILGPGNQYVTLAKQMVNAEGIAIDMPAGPSEVLVVADETCPPEYVAADLLSQAEHGSDSQVLLVTQDETLPAKVNDKIEDYLQFLSRDQYTMEALKNSKMIVMKSEDEMIDLVNFYAPEHLIVETDDPDRIGNRIVNAGSVFLGRYTPESLGDYASGTNHVLPTSGAARAYSGVNTDTFMKKITFQHATREGLQTIAPIVTRMAEAEWLDAHKLAVEVRLNEKQ